MRTIVENDKLIKKLFRRKQLTRNTRIAYLSIMTEYCTLMQMSPTDLRAEAYHEQLSIVDPLERRIEERLEDYYEYLSKRGLKNSTIVTKLGKVRAFYKEYKIQLPDNIELNVDYDKPDEDLILLKHIRQVVNNTSNVKYKAIVTLMASSGIRQIDVINMTIHDFLKATNRYHENTGSLEDKLELLNTGGVIPIWKFTPQKTRKKKNKTITCSSPESTEHILTYLKTREKLLEEDPLFLTIRKTKYRPGGFSDIFEALNTKNGYGSNTKGTIFFHGHSLRTFFASTLSKKKIEYTILKKMLGHTMGAVDQTYIHIDEDTVLESYLTVVDSLSVNEVKVHDIKTDKYAKIEKRLNEVEDELKYAQWANSLPKEQK